MSKSSTLGTNIAYDILNLTSIYDHVIVAHNMVSILNSETMSRHRLQYVQIKGPWADHGLVIHVITMCRNNDLNLKNIVSCLLSGKLKTVNKSQKPYTWILCYFLSLVKALMNPQDFSSVTLAHLDEKNTHSHPFTSTAVTSKYCVLIKNNHCFRH